MCLFFLWTASSGRSDPSGATREPDRDLLTIDDDGHLADTLAVRQHPLEISLALLHVDVFERDSPPFIILTGGLGVGSGVLAENQDHWAASLP